MKNAETRQKARSFTDLIVWQEGHKMGLMVYQRTKSFPKEEIFGLTNQVRRAAVSVTSNIAEGFNRKSEKDKMHFYVMAQGSVAEIQNQLLVARDVGYMNKDDFSELADRTVDIHKLLTGLIRAIAISSKQ